MLKEKIARNRYWNFRQLIKAAGGNNATARILGKNDNFVIHLVVKGGFLSVSPMTEAPLFVRSALLTAPAPTKSLTA